MTELGIIFAKGCSLGFLIAMVLGPIGIWCIQQTLSSGFWAGMAVGLGAAVADGIYGTLAGLGLTVIIDFLVQQQFWLQLGGGAFLCYLGIRSLLSKPATETALAQNQTSLVRLFTSTIFLTLANPVTILSFTALIATFGITASTFSLSYTVILFTSVFLGSTLWWIILSGGLTMARKYISLNILRTINLIAGCFMLGFGLLAIIAILL